MLEGTFVLGMASPTGLIIISVIALILFGPKSYLNLVVQSVQRYANLNLPQNILQKMTNH